MEDFTQHDQLNKSKGIKNEDMRWVARVIMLIKVDMKCNPLTSLHAAFFSDEDEVFKGKILVTFSVPGNVHSLRIHETVVFIFVLFFQYCNEE